MKGRRTFHYWTREYKIHHH